MTLSQLEDEPMEPDEQAVLAMIVESGAARIKRGLVESIHGKELVARMVAAGPDALLCSWTFARSAEFHRDGEGPAKSCVLETEVTLTPLAAERLCVDLLERGAAEEPAWIPRRLRMESGRLVSVMPGDGMPIEMPPTERTYPLPYPDMVPSREVEEQARSGGSVKRRRDRRRAG
jgi:hypothetical protein